jgi:predicted NUDIX family phosphoesterase
MSHKVDERVLVVPSSELDRLGRFQGFSAEADRYMTALLVPELMQYRPRSQVEEDPGYKQIIPYVVFRCADAVFCYLRGKSQGEARLHRLRSLGVGGHVSEEDAQGGKSLDAYESAMRRELDEEVEVASPGRILRVGLINDDSTPVGQVHLGVVHLFDLERPQVTAREEGLADSGFIPLATILPARHEFETWSQICIDAILKKGDAKKGDANL